jgi:cytochrome c oxidase cbb3-type subunit III
MSDISTGATSSSAAASSAASSSGKAEPKILGHNYDGIQEYDNPMPFWWTAIFWASFLLSVPYYLYYHVGVGATLNDSLEAEVGEFVEAQAAALGDLKPDAKTILTLVQNDAKLRTGASVMFRSNCATCHGPEGGGRTGPNLSDDSYINVKKPEDFFTVIRDGVAGKGMPDWGKRYSEPQLVLLASYAASLRGTKPAEAKEAQGTVLPQWSVPASEPSSPVAAPAPAGSSKPGGA